MIVCGAGAYRALACARKSPAVERGYSEKFKGAVTPFTPAISGTLVEKLPALDLKLNPEALYPDQVTVAWFSLKTPAKPSAASRTSTPRHGTLPKDIKGYAGRDI